MPRCVSFLTRAPLRSNLRRSVFIIPPISGCSTALGELPKGYFVWLYIHGWCAHIVQSAVNFVLKLDDGSASPMRSRHLISNTKYIATWDVVSIYANKTLRKIIQAAPRVYWNTTQISGLFIIHDIISSSAHCDDAMAYAFHITKPFIRRIHR